MFISIGDLDKFRDFESIKNKNMKPVGGIWASVYTPNNCYVSAWHEWCVMEGMTEFLSDKAVIFDIKDSAETLVINSQEDLDDVLEIYSLSNGFLNFEAISEDYDLIHLTEEGLEATRYSHALYGWDVQSIVVMNVDCIGDYEEITI